MKGTVRFNLRLDKQLKDGTAPIELIYSVANQRKYYNTGEKIYAASWDSAAQRGFFSTAKNAKKIKSQLKDGLTESEINSMNFRLDSLVNEIDNYETDFIRANTPFSSQMVIELLKGARTRLVKQEAPKDLVFDYIQQYVNSNSMVRAKGSLSVYKALSGHLKDFERHSGRRVKFDQIDHQFFQAFQNFLLSKSIIEKDGTVKHLQNTTIAKQLSTLKTFLK